MAILTAPSQTHWNYFLSIERDLEVLSRYVEFDVRNFDCFSIEIASILLAAGAEVDVVCKQVCRANNPRSRTSSINSYRTEINQILPGLPDFTVLIPRFGLTLQPWDEWHSQTGVPHWWTAYNKIKHHRDSHYDRANLKNAINAVAGLFIVVLHLYRQAAIDGELAPTPQLLKVGPNHDGGFIIGGNPVYNI